jgi:antitoxin ParD1/3/4
MATMNISLPDQMKEWVDATVEDGSYASASDYVRDLVRRDHERREAVARLQRVIDKGRESPASTHTVDEIFANARARALAILKARDDAA